MDQKRDAIVVVAVAMLCSLSLAFAVETMASYRNPPYIPSACFASKDMGTLTAAVGNTIWNNKAICGQKLKVTCIDENRENCKSSSVTVEVVDFCEGCDASIALSEEAFDIIANKDAGSVKVEYEQVHG